MQHVPGARRWFHWYVPLYPLAVRSMDLSAYDLVLSSSSAWVHGVRVRPDAVHICYCHTPFRYAWSHFPEGPGHDARVVAIKPFLRWVRRRDIKKARRVDQYIANSGVTQRRISEYFGRDSTVIHPPVDTTQFFLSEDVGDYFLVVAPLVPYKRVELAVEAMNRLGLPLVVVGTGPQQRKLRALAGPTVQFLGYMPDAELRSLYSRCRALVFPQEEDFGLVPIEAMASGRPVVAYGAGGALEWMVDGITGIMFPEQTVDSLIAAITRFKRHDVRRPPDPDPCRDLLDCAF